MKIEIDSNMYFVNFKNLLWINIINTTISPYIDFIFTKNSLRLSKDQMEDIEWNKAIGIIDSWNKQNDPTRPLN